MKVMKIYHNLEFFTTRGIYIGTDSVRGVDMGEALGGLSIDE